MSANATHTGSASSSESSPSLGAIVHPSLNSLMLSHTFLILLIPLTISLFYFSTPQSRHRPLFALNLVSIFLAFLVSVLSDAVSVHSVLEPLKPWSIAVNLIIGFVAVWQSILVDLTLLIRLISVYPSIQIGQRRFYLLIAIPVLLKLTRAINLILFTQVLVDIMYGPNPAVMGRIAFIRKPYIKIEWTTQMIDNTYASLAFLWKIRDKGNKGIMAHCSRGTWVQRMRTLFRIALTNFIVPTVFSIAQFICAYRHTDAAVINQLMLVNTMLATFGVAFATVWAGNISREEAQMLDSKRHNDTGRAIPVFAIGPVRMAKQSTSFTIDDTMSMTDEAVSNRV